MMFEPPQITVRKGEQIRFVLFNEGTESHEFVLATAAENRKHAELRRNFRECNTQIPTPSASPYSSKASSYGNSIK